MPRLNEITPARQHILRTLAVHGDMPVSELHALIGADEKEATQEHVRRLKTLGLIGTDTRTAPGRAAPIVLTRKGRAAAGFGSQPARSASAAPRTLVNAASTGGTYDSAELHRQSTVRPTGDHALALPSRMGDRLHYRDGRVTDLHGRPLAS